MSTGFATAFSEITLVLFTTLAPSGAVAYALMSFPIIRGRLSDDAHRRIDKALCIPLIVSLVGLVASATHLGNPANALYVFMGVGRSPLSNEVFSAVIFLAFSGVYWLYSFAVKPRRLLQRLLAVGACVSAIVGLRAARWKSRGNRFGRLMLVLAVVALAACLVVYALQGAIVLPAENAVLSASDLVPHYALLVCVFAVFAAAGIAVDALPLFRSSVSREGKASPDEMTISVVRASVAALLVLAGIFVMRFSFYMMHMTVGISF